MLLEFKYFNNGGKFAPFVGAGVGVFFLANVDFDSNASTSSSGIASGTKLGGLVRAGFESSKFRMALEYNIVPASTWDVTIGSVPAGKVENSYFGIKVGFFIGGGAWGGGSR